MSDEQQSVALFLPQLEGLPLLLRPAALKIAYEGRPHFAIPALLDEKTVTAGLTQVV
jgi:hypothetical protein